MKVALADLRHHATAFSRGPRARKLALWVVGVLAAIGVLGFLVAPPIARSLLERELTDVLHRKVTIASLRINPYALSVTVRGLRVDERGATTPALSVDELYADASLASIFRAAPVLSALILTKPQVRVVRLEGNSYNWSDLVDEFINKPRDPNEPLPRFALANIEVLDGNIDFDDRPEGAKHAVSAIELAVPFLSSLPIHQEITVEPKFSAKVDGTAFELIAKAKPFKDTHDSTLNVDVHGLDVTRYLAYVPGKLPLQVRSARLETDLDITFAQPKGRAPSIVLAGVVALNQVEVWQPSNAPLMKLPRLALRLRAVEPLARRIEIAKVEIEAPDIQVQRRKSGEFFLAQLIIPAPHAKKAEENPQHAAPTWSYQIDEVVMTAGKLDIADEYNARPVRVIIDDVHLTVQGISSVPAAAGHFEASIHAKPDASLALLGDFGLQPLHAEGSLEIEHLKLPALWAYAEPFVALDATDGELKVATAYTYSVDPRAPKIELKGMRAALHSLVLRQRNDKQEVLRMPTLAANAVDVDLLAQTLSVGELTASGGRVAVRRDRDGTFNLQRVLIQKVNEVAKPVAPAAAAKPWVVTLKKVAIDRYAATVEDAAAGPAATANIENLGLTAVNLSTAKGKRSNITLKLTLNKTGSLALTGPLVIDPLSARVKIDARNLGIVPAQPYFERYVNAIVSSGEITASGEAAFALPQGAQAHGNFKGDVTLANFAAVTKGANEDLLRWKSLLLRGVDAALEPLSVAIGEIALSEFYSRLVLSPEGHLNLEGVIAKDGPPVADSSALAEAAPSATSAKPAPASIQPAAPTPAAMPDIRIGKISLAGGNVNFSDFFIKPNYSANLTGLSGSVSAITRDLPGDVDLHAKIDNTAPVEIAGKLNPLAKDLFLDIKASAHDIELSPLTPYAAKYVGYGVEKGKLSMKVAYRLDNRKLTAENNVILDQLTFGAKLDSPTATKLPVLFAVSLLKDRNGVIDINLPISGSIDDPKFSVGGIIVQVILNLIVKAVTAPFALIGSLFGGGEELAYVEFAPGSAKVTPAAEGKLKNLIKALVDRPGLKLDAAGRVYAEDDRDGLKKISIERKVKAQKLKDMVKGGTAAGALDEIIVEPGEYAKYLARAYGEEKFTKPRNVIGIAKSLPVPEMEELMLTNLPATDDDLRLLANQRAQAVKDYLVEVGKVPAERVFLVVPKLSAEGIKDKGRPTRVDFSLK